MRSRSTAPARSSSRSSTRSEARSGRADSNRRPLAPKASALTRLSYTPAGLSVQCGKVEELFLGEAAELGDLLAPQVGALTGTHPLQELADE
jgi:hypothetical protein